MAKIKLTTFERRARRNRTAIKERANGRPRLSVFRSEQHIYAQIIDDADGKTLVSASTVDKELKGKLKSTATIAAAQTVGKLIAERAQKAGVSEIVFDRGAYLYHGRVKALAESARSSGLAF